MSSITHANARFTPAGRLQLVRLVLHDGWTQSRVAERFQCHRATVSKRVARYQAEGEAGLHDHSSRPRHSPTRTAQRTERRIVALKVTRR